MNRTLGRLVALVTLIAYFMLNTQLSLALAVCFQPANAMRQKAAERVDDTTPGCSRCAKKSAGSKQTPCTERETENAEHPSESECPSCPCCPCNGKHCPVPGGCASCNPAKAPCLLPPNLIGRSTELVGFLDFCHDFMFLPPFLDSQVRPPRI